MGECEKEQTEALAGPSDHAAPMDYDTLVGTIAQAHDQAQRQAVQAINLALTLRNWLIGCQIVEYEQHGSDRAKYGERLLESLARDLRRRLGRGFGGRNLEMFRRFYIRYPIPQSVIAESGMTVQWQPSRPIASQDWQDDAYFVRLFQSLSWTHFIEMCRMDDPLKRAFYEVETLQNHWSVRELKRQIDSLLYERVGLSRNKEGVLALAKEGELVTTPAEMVRDPYVFEFLGLKREELYTFLEPPVSSPGLRPHAYLDARTSGFLSSSRSISLPSTLTWRRSRRGPSTVTNVRPCFSL
jgi:hypothetical protein